MFLSRRRGAIVARMKQQRGGAGQPARGDERVLVPAGGGRGAACRDPHREYEGSEPLGSTASWYSQRTVRKTVALTNFILGARQACEQWEKGEKAAAREVADKTAALLQSEAEALDDAPLRTEAELARKLAALMVP